MPSKSQEWEDLRKERHKKPWGYQTAAFGFYRARLLPGFWLQPFSLLRPPDGSTVSTCRVWGPMGLRKRLLWRPPAAQALRVHQASSPAQQGLSSPKARQWHLLSQEREPEFARQPARPCPSLTLSPGLFLAPSSGWGRRKELFRKVWEAAAFCTFQHKVSLNMEQTPRSLAHWPGYSAPWPANVVAVLQHGSTGFCNYLRGTSMWRRNHPGWVGALVN